MAAPHPAATAWASGTLALLSVEQSALLVAFVRSDYQRVVRIVSHVCAGTADPENLVAEATARLVDQLSRRKPVESFSAWVTRCAINLGQSERRRFLVRQRKNPALAAIGEQDETSRLVDDLVLRDAVRTLPRRQAEAVALYYGLDLSVAEVAVALGITEGGTKALLAKARASLSRTLGGDHEETEDE